MDELHDPQNDESSSGEDRASRVRRRRFVRPAVDIYSTESEMVVLADMPGAEKNAVDITVDGDDLVLEAEVVARKEAESSLPWGYHRRFKLRSDFDRNKISGSLESGVLQITLPRAARKKAKKVKIT